MASSVSLFLILVLIIGVLPLSMFLLRSLQDGNKRSDALDEELTLKGEGAEAVEWWEARRSAFNRSLLAAGIFVIALYYLLLQMRVASAGLGQMTFSWRNFIFLLVIYLIYMGIANLLYNVGVFSEQARRPREVHDYRERAYQVIYWSAILAPFAVVLFKAF